MLDKLVLSISILCILLEEINTSKSLTDVSSKLAIIKIELNRLIFLPDITSPSFSSTSSIKDILFESNLLSIFKCKIAFGYTPFLI